MSKTDENVKANEGIYYENICVFTLAKNMAVSFGLFQSILIKILNM
jgi:hypothetical protein